MKINIAIQDLEETGNGDKTQLKSSGKIQLQINIPNDQIEITKIAKVVLTRTEPICGFVVGTCC